MKDKKYYCACNGDKCEGTCREQHLHRKRTWTNPKDLCPAAYEVTKNEKKI